MSHIFLYGPPGTGKSTIGKILARSLDLPFVDVDRLIESNAGIPIAQIMEQQGESTFRDLETSALKEIVGHASREASPNGGSVTGSQDQVIALGGGALLRQENRSFVEAHGRVVLLMAELTTLLERLENESGKRPLLAGDLREKLASLLEGRREHYSSFAIQSQVDGKTAEQNALQIQTRLGRFHLRAMGKYDVLVQSVGQIGNLSNERGLHNPIVVTDENIAPFHAASMVASLRNAGFTPQVIIIPAGEAHKNLETIQR